MNIKRYIWVIAAVAGVAATGVGLWQDQFTSVVRWAGTLCTSCIGLSK